MIGCTAPFGEQSRNIARNAWLQAGYPPEVPATTLDRRCGSAQTAVEMGAALVASGTHDVVIAGGVEHMGHVPIDSPGKISELYGDPWPAELRDRYGFVHQGESAELIADRWQLGREEMDDLRRALAPERRRRPSRDGRFARRDGADDARRPDPPRRPDACAPETTVETSGQPQAGVPQGGRADHRRASSSPISDGAAGACSLSPGGRAPARAAPRARIVDQTTVGVDPIIMLTGPDPRDLEVVGTQRPRRSTTSTCSRSTRRSPRWCWPGSASSSPTWTG